jgi:hypothetical protein
LGAWDELKVEIETLLHEETTVSLKWIAARLKMGAWTHVFKLIYHAKAN